MRQYAVASGVAGDGRASVLTVHDDGRVTFRVQRGQIIENAHTLPRSQAADWLWRMRRMRRETRRMRPDRRLEIARFCFARHAS